MRILNLFFLFAISFSVNSQQAFSAKRTTAVPKTIKFKGKMVEAWTWKDNLGENILILSVLGPYSKDEYSNIELFANHYNKKDTGYKQLWRLNDIVKECELDMVGEFIKGSTTITDLDKDGVAETIVQYRRACRGDISPCYMKLIMHEDTLKYALRGSMWADMHGDNKKPSPITEKDANLAKLPGYKGTDDEWEKELGRYENEKEFAKAPPEFITFARKQWLKFVKDGFD
jgi:hypothetical protein